MRKQPAVPALQTFTTAAIGDSDGTTAIDLIAPCEGASINQVSATMKTAGGTTGTFTLVIETASGVLSDPLTVDADAVAGTHLGVAEGTSVQAAEGERLSLTTVKTGTVSSGAVLLLSILWRL